MEKRVTAKDALPSFDDWARENGCDNCKKPPEDRWFCLLCKERWLNDMP